MRIEKVVPNSDGSITLDNAKIAYICDGLSCTDCPHEECHHTFDVEHAVNFKNEKRNSTLKIINSSNFRKVTLTNGEVSYWEVEIGKESEVFTK